jgi:hypothetical protein
MKITKKDFSDYVCGWLFIIEGDENLENLDLNNMRAALLNAESMIDDYQDGIESYVERKSLAQSSNKQV